MVNTTSGSVQGFTDDITPNVAQYLGIPFAEPPVGTRRWLPPAPKQRENQTIKATAFLPACPQFEGNQSNVWHIDAPEFLIQPPNYQSEDCLNLNIWTPLEQCKDQSEEKELLPVLIWIYGGGYTTGGADVPYQNPQRWVERSGEHIVVAISYRVNIFGFPNAQSLADDEQNLGLLDQRLAVEWARDNIQNFGGDPDRMILWGQSAGGNSVDQYNFAYPEDPIVSGLILNSGTNFIGIGSKDVQKTNFTFVANHFGCNGPNAEAEIDCLRGVDSTAITHYLKGYADSGTSPGLSFVPIVDNRMVFANYTARALAGKFSRKPAIIGNTNNEGTAFVPYNRTYGPANMTAVNAATASIFHCPAVKATQDRYAANATTFRYLYTGNFSNISPQPWEGAYHSSDLPMYFGTYGIARGNGTAFERAVSEKTQDYYLAFAKDPVHGLPKIGWKAYEPNGEAVLIAYDGKVVQGIEESVLEKPCNGQTPNGLPIPP
ncbi:para-nitrobenzyl esterase [Pyrenophora seminiperda CCB06]|uniref:Carboxylic ester hydrolase n=1 Tax=Pyrenophora seminiperda CCB06 TaxID=1302712 RepID=A0A3M7MBW1_9PLEO|nr:para-nitrobenzyl esterase [Pyrenophora seminiperda CCB06]